MVTVQIWGSMRFATDGKAHVEVDAKNFGQLLRKLSEEYPALKPQIDRGVSLALDGTIYRDAWFTEISPDSEVVLMPYMAGG